ncbi:hypothetical protein C8N46_11364 [Kordia periserrulae]|uniref:Uncharacterized protein n=1 Tax=Kordia periserrulae TaxID=701523 RepID=A0A2T6BR72_9FLAO|nr:hypothetical protein [Kordia periserrulae]PTX58573.1 hypothetical protein C8N46_11364 [Kordia periserrulae]
MDKDMLEYLKSEMDKDMQKKRAALEQELRNNRENIKPVGSAKMQAKALEEHEKQKRIELEAKMKEYQKRLESQRFKDVGGSYDAARRQLEQNQNTNEVNTKQMELDRQNREAVERAEQAQNLKHERDQKKRKEENEKKKSQELKNQEQTKEFAQKAERDRLRAQFNRENDRYKDRGR